MAPEIPAFLAKPALTFKGHLKPLSRRRLERNNNRAERREKGEDGISDNEANELTPFLMVVPSGEKPIPGDATNTAPQPIVPSHTLTKLLFDDTVAEKNSFRPTIIAFRRLSIRWPRTGFLALDVVFAGVARTYPSSNFKMVKRRDD
ncbi:hypothetical protein B0H17DRAFT_1133523 [Mycena rosella]|uniref:Uncharacterized protein n=1 Tax=Mycena rosella TaxID=1033263 RepID=A0AAD7GHX4_MYCRO|nr:hypothetical protein B0H17DRAFT_1133523 [Mycena rosella]